MKDLITTEYKHTLWKDEFGDDFLLLKFGEVYESPYGKNNLRLVTWAKPIRNKLTKLGLILNEDGTDDPLWILDLKRADLPILLKLGAGKNRFAKNSKWLKDKEEKLAHKILPYNPNLRSQL